MKSKLARRLISCLTATTLAVSLAATTVSAQVFSVDVVDEVLGDKTVNGFSDEILTYPHTDADKGKQVLRIAPGGQTDIDFAEPIDYGESFLFEFDVKALTDDSSFNLNYVNTGKEEIQGTAARGEEMDHSTGNEFLVGSTKNGSICFYRAVGSGTLSDNTAEFVKDKWYNVKIYFDKYLSMMNLFVDDVFVDARAMPSLDNEIYIAADKLYTLRVFSRGDNSNILLDNVSAKWLDYETSQQYKEHLDLVYMSRCHRGIDADPKLGVLGNIFTDKDTQNAEITLTNRTGQPFKGSAKIEAINADTLETLYTVNDIPVEVETGTDAQKKSVINTEIKTGRYGQFNLKLTIYNNEGKEFSTQLIPYSVVNAPEKGSKKNTKVGFTYAFAYYRTQDFENMETQFKLMDLLGIGFLRSDHWGMLPSGYTYDLVETDKNYLDLINKYKIPRLMVTLNGAPNLSQNVTHGDMTMRTEEVRQYCEDWAYAMSSQIDDYTKDMKDLEVIYSVMNEPNYEQSFVANPLTYGWYLKGFYDGIKKSDPTNEVYGFCLGGFEIEYVRRALAGFEDGELPMDGLTMHPYTSDSPESQDWINRSKQVKEGVYAYDQLEGSKLYADEVGFSAAHVGDYSFDKSRAVNEKEQCDYNIRRQIMNDFHQIYESVGLYTFADFPASDGSTFLTRSEVVFGLVHAPYDEEVPYAAKDAYLALAYYNKIMTDAQPIKEFNGNDGREMGYLFDTVGKDNTLILYNTEGRKANDASGSVSYKINTPSVKVCDIYGNEETVYPVNGVYTFGTSERPVYVRGNFTDAEMVDTKIAIDNNVVSMAAGDKGILRIDNTTGRDIDYTVKTRGNIKAEVKKLSKTVTEIHVNSIGAPPEGYTAKDDAIFITGTCGGKHVYDQYVRMSYDDPVSAYFTVVPANAAATKWVGTLGIVNQSAEKVLNGKVKIKSPGILAEKLGEFTIKNLKPKTSQDFTFNIPVEYAGASMKLEVEALIDGQEDALDFTFTSDCRTAKYAHTKPTIDGKIEEGEWDTMPLYINRKDQTFKIVKESNWWAGPEDLSATGYLMWDEENMYLAVDVTDDDFYTYDGSDDTMIWQQDGIQFGVANKKSDSSFTEVAVGKMGDKDVIKFFSSTIPNIALGDLQGSEAVVIREGTKTTYEVKIPWSKMVPDTSLIKEFNSFVFSYIVNDGDNTLPADVQAKLDTNGTQAPHRYGYAEYYVDPVRGGGIGSAKDPDLFLEFTLLK